MIYVNDKWETCLHGAQKFGKFNTQFMFSKCELMIERSGESEAWQQETKSGSNLHFFHFYWTFPLHDYQRAVMYFVGIVNRSEDDE